MMSFNKFDHLSDDEIETWIAQSEDELDDLEDRGWNTDEFGHAVFSNMTSYLMSDISQEIDQAKQELKRRQEQAG